MRLGERPRLWCDKSLKCQNLSEQSQENDDNKSMVKYRQQELQKKAWVRTVIIDERVKTILAQEWADIVLCET